MKRLVTCNSLQCYNHPHTFFHKININLRQNQDSWTSIKKMKCWTQRAKVQDQATPRYILCIFRPYQVHKAKISIRIHHFIFPWWKIGISLRKRSIRTINITRRRRNSPTWRKAPQTMCRSLQTKNIQISSHMTKDANLNWIISYQVTYSYA